MNPLSSLGFNWLDTVFVLIIAANMLASYREGFIAKVVGLLGLLAAIYAAGHLTFIGVNVLTALHYGGPGLRGTLAFAVTFLVILIGSRIVAAVLTRAAGMMMLGLPNRLGGALAGLLEGLIIVLVIIFLILHFRLDVYRSALQTSVIAHNLTPRYLNILVGLLPADLHRLAPWLR